MTRLTCSSESKAAPVRRGRAATSGAAHHSSQEEGLQRPGVGCGFRGRWRNHVAFASLPSGDPGHNTSGYAVLGSTTAAASHGKLREVDMRIVVIGGTGLIGSKIVAILTADKIDVVAAGLETGVNSLTGEGLADVMKGATVVVDVSNSPS